MSKYDFDSFLQEEIRREENRRFVEEIRQDVFQQLHEANIRRVYDIDADLNGQFAEEYAAQRANYYFDNPSEAFDGDEIPDDRDVMESIIFRRAIYDAQIRNLHERSLMNEVVLLLAHEKAGMNVEELTRAKKAYLADLIVEGWDINDEIVQFFIKVTPGGSIDISSEQDRQHLVDSMINTAELEERSRYLSDTIFLVAEILYVNSDTEQLDCQAIATDIVMTGYTTQLASSFGDKSAAARRESDVREACRSNGLVIDIENRDTVAELIIGALNDRYPLTDEIL